MAEQHTLTVKITGDSSQLVAALNRAQAELAQLDRQSNQTSAGFDDIGRAGGLAGGMMASFAGNLASIGFTAAIQGAIQFGTELYNIGRASQVAGNTFAVLQGGAEQASASLAMLQEATNFTIPDTTLMSISNLYTQMGLATDPAEVARLAEMGATLGQAMGSSAEEAMRTFSFLLSNQSIELLDTFGISSGKVRERIQDLQKANGDLARDQAFVTAVLEEGSVAMERLGIVTEQNVSSVGKLTTRFQNFAAVVGQDVAGAVEGFASGLNDFFEDVEKTEEIADKMMSALRDVASPIVQDYAGLNEMYFTNLAYRVAALVEETGSYQKALMQLEQSFIKTPVMNEQIRFLEEYAQALERLNIRSQRDIFLSTLDMPTNVFSDPQQLRALEAQERQRQILQRNIEDLDLILLDQENLTYALEQFTGGAGIITAEEVAYADELVIRIRQLAEDIGEDSDAVKGALKFADELERASQNALDAKNYIDNIGLETVLGLGLPPEQRLTADILKMAGIEGRQAEYLTGQRTQLSEMFESSVLPLLQGIETQFGEDEAARVGDFIAQLMKEGIARGFESNPVQLMEFILGNVDYRYDEGQARSVVVQAGDTLSAIAQREGVSVQLLAEINRLEDPNKILAGQELVVEVGARVTRLVSPEEMDQMQLDSLRGFAMPTATGEDGEPMKPLGVEATGIDQTLLTAQELQATMSEIVPPLITPAKMGFVSGDVADPGVVEVIDSIGQKLQDISSRIYQVSMTVNLDANIRTGAGFKIIPITMAELANDISESARMFRLAQGGR